MIMDAKNEARAIPAKEIDKFFKSVKKGKTESKSGCLKSIMAMYLLKNKVSMYCAQGVNFQDYLYVPEAMNNAETGLTYTPLTGKRKQSVGDAEKLWSPEVAKWLKVNGFLNEGSFVEMVSNWYKTSDGRGLTEADHWMPWYKEERDYSTLDGNRPIRGIRGFTREVVVALTTNIESQEFRRRYGLEKGLLPEHPRAGSTDDLEGIFSFLHGLLGPIFDEKDFHDAFPKVIRRVHQEM
ncbi:Hypothetical predicted protein [Paramuricea clavata]|uniref:Uncharacterized protein n=1 Tax=Paramuricea clavata TaxID=317549 RepID=A0A6S7I531_PARCT|nr:Hypothetical predicted protein [Paramuricea clavata]